MTGDFAELPIAYPQQTISVRERLIKSDGNFVERVLEGVLAENSSSLDPKNKPHVIKQIKNISEILVDLGLRLNPQKTVTSNNVIKDSLKPDKWFWLLRKRGNKGLQDHLLLIHALSKEHPNSGSLVKAMNNFFARIRTLQRTKQNVTVLISIVVDIAYRSPRLYPISTAILSKLFSFLPPDKINEAIDLIVRKFSKLPNTGHMQVWLQRAIWKYDEKRVFEEKLCQKLVDDSVVLWNSEWLSGGIARVIDRHSVVNKEVLEGMDAVVTQDEVQLFGTKSNYYG